MRINDFLTDMYLFNDLSSIFSWDSGKDLIKVLKAEEFNANTVVYSSALAVNIQGQFLITSISPKYDPLTYVLKHKFLEARQFTRPSKIK